MNNIPKRKGGVVFWDEEDTSDIIAKTEEKPSAVVAKKEDDYNGNKEAELYAKIASLEEELRVRDEEIAQLKETIDKFPEPEAPETNDPPRQPEEHTEKTDNRSILLAAAAAVVAIMVLNS